jgi:uncharacterized protein YegJ (DUF2314 family)
MIRAAFIALVLAATPARAQDPVTLFADDDVAMTAAITEAQRTLPMFLANVLDGEQIGQQGSGVKVAIAAVQQNGNEHIWVMPFRLWPSGTFSGYLANAPVDLGPLRIGDRIDFTRDQISDWSFSSGDGLLFGNYSSRVMHGTGAMGDTPFDAIFTPDPVPQDWK